MNNNDSKPPGSTLANRLRALRDRLRYLLTGRPASRTDLAAVLRQAQTRGLLDRDALDMIEGVLQVSEIKVRDIMVPRGQMDVVDRTEPPETYLPRIIQSGHSRFPMVEGDRDKVLGILLAKDLLRYFMLEKRKRAQFNVNDMLRPAVFVPESKRLNVLLREFRASRNHMAIVVDEYGGVAGLITIEDVLEQIVGEIKDEYDIDAEDVTIVERGKDEFVVKAVATLEDFNARFATSLSHGDVETIGGLFAARLGRVPSRGEAIDLDGWRVEVLRADSRRAHLLRVTRSAATLERAAS